MQLTDEQKKTILSCEKEVIEILKRNDCHLEGVTILRNGNIDVQIIIALNLPAPTADKPAEGLKV